MVTAKDFILRVLIPLREAWGYIYGYAGVMWTAALQDRIEKTTDENRRASREYGSQWIGRMVTDCSGLLRWALKIFGIDIVHHARYQYTNWCKAKGKLIGGRRDDGQPILPGTAVFLKGTKDMIHHVGVYVGSGICVEAKGARYGVVTSALDHWDHWGELKCVDYTDAASLEDGIEIPERGDAPAAEYPRAVVCNPSTWLNVRKQPRSSAQLVFRVEKGSVVDVLETSSGADWWQIRFGGQIGWAFAQYLRLIEPDVDEPGDTDPVITPDPSPPAAEEQPAAVPAPEDPQDPDHAADITAAISELRNIRDRIDQVLRILGGS